MIDNAICDLNGEPYRSEEFTFTVLRTQTAFADATRFVTPADCWGDIGAASGPLFANLAIAAAQRGYAKGPRALLWASSDRWRSRGDRRPHYRPMPEESTITVNPPKTPVTEGSGGKSLATTPNVCKMPGPPAPFVPTPLPNLGTSGDRLHDGTTTVKFEGKKVAIKGSYFMSQPSGDVASQGTGGGIISARTEGKTEWLAPGSMDVKAEGKNIQLLGDAMGNNGGSPVNAATMKELQDALGGVAEADALCKSICDTLNDPTKDQRQAEASGGGFS